MSLLVAPHLSIDLVSLPRETENPIICYNAKKVTATDFAIVSLQSSLYLIAWEGFSQRRCGHIPPRTSTWHHPFIMSIGF